MLTYNTRLDRLSLPEFGRNVQRMVEHCKTISDRDERTRCAYSIVESMYRLLPPTGDQQEYRRKLWDQLAIISNFDLDIDWPYEVIKRDDLDSKPDPVLLPGYNIRKRQYGKNIELMIDQISQIPQGEERDVLVSLIANHMKKLLVTADNDSVEDARVFNDLRLLSHGAINVSPDDLHLHEFKALPLPKKKKKK